MRLLAVVFAFLLVIPAVGASMIAVMGFMFPPFGVLGLLLAAMIVFQLQACLRLWNGDHGPIRPGEKNAFGGGAIVSTIMLSWILSMGVGERGYRFLAAGIGLLLTSVLLPLTAAHKRFHQQQDANSDIRPIDE